MKDQAHTAAEKASHLINHVVKYGDSHLKTGAHQLSLFQYYMFDIFLCICFLLITWSALLITCVYCSCRIVISRIRYTGKVKTS